MSPAPSDVPANKDECGDESLNLEHDLVPTIEIQESEESSDEETDGDAEHVAYEGYVVLKQQSFEEGDSNEDNNCRSTCSNHVDNSILCRENGADSRDDKSVDADGIAQGETSDRSQAHQLEEKSASTNQPAFQITDTHAEVIKQAIAGFALPTSNIPEWARVVPEENWKSKLMDSIAKKQF